MHRAFINRCHFMLKPCPRMSSSDHLIIPGEAASESDHIVCAAPRARKRARKSTWNEHGPDTLVLLLGGQAPLHARAAQTVGQWRSAAGLDATPVIPDGGAILGILVVSWHLQELEDTIADAQAMRQCLAHSERSYCQPWAVLDYEIIKAIKLPEYVELGQGMELSHTFKCLGSLVSACHPDATVIGQAQGTMDFKGWHQVPFAIGELMVAGKWPLLHSVPLSQRQRKPFLHFSAPAPADLRGFLKKVRQKKPAAQNLEAPCAAPPQLFTIRATDPCHLLRHDQAPEEHARGP